MKDRFNIKKWELSGLIINLIVFKIFTGDIKYFMTGSNSAFLSALISCLIFYGFYWFLPLIYESVFKRLKKVNIIKFIFGLALIFYLVFSFRKYLLSIADFFNIAAFPNAPFIFIAGFFIICAFISALKGMDAAIKPNSLIAFQIIFFTACSLFAVLKFSDVTNIFPVFGKGIKETTWTGIKSIWIFADVLLSVFVFDFYEDKKNLKKTVRTAGGIGALVLFSVVLFSNLIVPPDILKEIQFPFYQIIKNAYFGRFFQRIDAFYIIVLSLCLMSYFSFILFLMSYIFKKIFNLSNMKVLYLSFALISLILCLV